MTALRTRCCAAIAALCLSAPAFCSPLDDTDKQKHFAVSAALGLAAAEFVGEESYSAVKAFGLAMVPGLIKELHDSRKGGSGFSHQDMAANALGAALGVSVGKGVTLMLQRHPDDKKSLFITLSSRFN